MGIRSDNGYIFFNEILYRCMKRKYGNMKINKKMQIFELRTQYSIYLMTRTIQDKTKVNISNDDIIRNLIEKKNGVNPFLTVMNFKISFKTWLKFAREVLENNDDKITTNQVQRFSISKKKKVGVEFTVAVDIEKEDLYEVTSDEEYTQD